MATAEIVRDASTATTSTVVPLLSGYIPGSTQEYGITTSSQQSPAPVFFAPHHGHALATYWGSLLLGSVHAFYSFVPSTSNSVAWERLSLELMRIASLEPNWDGEEADAVSLVAVNNAALLLSNAKMLIAHSTIIEDTVPALIPSVDGGVILKWLRGNKELKCTIFGERVEVVRWRSLDRYESDGFWEVAVPQVSEHFEWLLQ